MTELFRYVSKSVITVTSDYMNVFVLLMAHLFAIRPKPKHSGSMSRVAQEYLSIYRIWFVVDMLHTDVVTTELAVFQIVSGLQELWI